MKLLNVSLEVFRLLYVLKLATELAIQTGQFRDEFSQ